MDRNYFQGWVKILAWSLCLAPMAMSLLTGRISSDLGWGEYLTIIPFAAVILGAPQIAMLAVVMLSKKQLVRVLAVILSTGMAMYFLYFIVTADFTGSSTASLGMFFVQLYLAAGAFLVMGVLSVIVRLATNNTKDT